MKKTRNILAICTLLLSVTSTALAANPFDDVPKNHWAYDSISKLAKAGYVDGYGDGTFRGDKPLTRYEMAQIVGKIISDVDKLHNADAASNSEVLKLEKEFNDELQSFGVRLSKVEANQSNVKLTADMRTRWNTFKDKPNSTQWRDRFRLNMTSQINGNSIFYARFVFDDDKFNQDTSQRLSDMNLTTKGLITNTNITFGRYTLNMGPTGYLAGTTGDLDGIMTNSNIGNFSLMLGYAQVRQSLLVSTPTGTSNSNGNTLISNGMYIKNIDFAQASYSTGKTKIYGEYLKNLGAGKNDDNGNTVKNAYDILGGGVAYKFDSNWKLTGEYYKNSAENAKLSDGSSPTATIAHVDYKGAVASKPHSWGAFLEYTKFEGNSLPYQFSGPFTRSNPADFGVSPAKSGVKMLGAQIDYTLAKNVTFNGVYQWNVKDTETGKAAPYSSWTRAQINYFF